MLNEELFDNKKETIKSIKARGNIAILYFIFILKVKH